MITDAAANRYALALYEMAADPAEAGRYLAQLDEVAQALGSSDELRRVIAHPLIEPAVKERVLVRLYGADLSEAVRNFLGVVCARGRAGEVAMVVEALRARVDAAEGRHRALVRSVEALEPGQVKALREALEKRLGGTVEIEAETDPGLIGGIEVRVGGQVLDLSVERRLRDLRRHLMDPGSQAPGEGVQPS